MAGGHGGCNYVEVIKLNWIFISLFGDEPSTSDVSNRQAMRLAPLKNSPNPGSPLTTAPNTETTVHSLMPTSALPTQQTTHSIPKIGQTGEDSLGCLKDQDAKSVHCYTIPPKGQRKNSTNIAKITFRTHELPLQTMDDIQSYMLKTQDPITRAPSTFEVVADIHTPPTNIPPTPLPPNSSKDSTSPSTPTIHPSDTHPPTTNTPPHLLPPNTTQPL
ncbi:salivary glue protein Sgs-3-like [Penaeus vannamei]|uniref:salivary glue protein Sgs-3-like n=1 Tax=Penaeus vannamei TaxID=6689 RepID=UPI00387F86FF